MNKQKKRNSNSFRKGLRKKNLQVQKQQRHQFSMKMKRVFGGLETPSNSEIVYHSVTDNFKNFIEMLNYSLIQNNFKFDCVEGNISDNRTIKRNKGKIILDETIRSITINFSSNEFYLQFVPYNNEIHLHQIRIKPQFQKNGLGRKLMEIITDVSTLLNINVSLIPVSMDGIIPIEKLENFYSKCGFILDKETYHWNYGFQKGNVINLNQQYEYRMVG